MQLSTGDRLTGGIIDITPNNITISLNDSVTVKATLADSLSYNIGDIASFTIKDINKEQVLFLKQVPILTEIFLMTRQSRPHLKMQDFRLMKSLSYL